ncbi:profilin-domain-containing protein [Phyllosticta citricarpa]|uniref:Profilin n=1 Tax=Phyllosticta citricarpa TaxID=55181 RepID=A0ABR1MQF9_9PEZI
MDISSFKITTAVSAAVRSVRKDVSSSMTPFRTSRHSSNLVGTGNIDKAAIFNAEGNSVWAASPGFTVAPNEMAEIVNAYKDKGDANGIKQVQSTGLHVAGERFVVLKADERSLYGKKGKEGLVIVKTTQAILVTHYPESVQPGAAANTVEQLADYLISVGY